MKTMNKFILGCLLTLAGFIGVNAQTETYAGAQFLRVNPDVVRPTVRYDNQTDSFGVVANRTWYQTKSIGLTAETSANFNTADNKGNQLYTLMGGVTLKYRGHANVQPFVTGTAGLGVLHLNEQTYGIAVYPANTDANVAFKTSAGVDVGKKVKWRVVELGYLQTRFFNQTQNNFVASTGVIF